MFEELPNTPLKPGSGHWPFRLAVTFVLMVVVDCEFLKHFVAKIVKLEFLEEQGFWDAMGSTEDPLALVVCENGFETGSVPIQEELFPFLIPELHQPVFVRQQGVRVTS